MADDVSSLMLDKCVIAYGQIHWHSNNWLVGTVFQLTGSLQLLPPVSPILAVQFAVLCM